MSYRISGNYIASCSCALICGCPVDASPRDPKGGTECYGIALFRVASGENDGVDLSGVTFAFYNYFPSNVTAGNWKAGVVIDEGASDDQTTALGAILSGEAGGPFAEFAPLIAENLGLERAKVTVGKDSGSVAGKSDVAVQLRTGPDGSPTTIKGAMFGFAAEYGVGSSTGSSNAFGLSFEPSYGEAADFEFASEGSPVHGRA